MPEPRTCGRITAWATALLMTASCTAGTSAPEPVRPPPRAGQHVTLEVWSKFSDTELDVFNGVLADFEREHPNIRIRSVGDQSTDKVMQAIRGGDPPDVSALVSAEQLGQFCSSGAWQDLRPYVERDGVDLGMIPDAVREYTTFRGTRCAMPMLADVYGLYYNAEAFEEAGIKSPPRTTSELAEVAKRLTKFNEDGTIDVAGFLPVLASQTNHPWFWAPHWGVRWLDQRGRSALGEDPAWAEMFRWQRDLVDFYGWDELSRFTAGLGQVYSAENAFQQGKVAMVIDGEYRTRFIEEQAPDLRYGTAPFPVSDSKPWLYGTGFTTGSVVGIPRGAPHAGAAWELVRYLSTDTDAQVRLANGLHNVPSTVPALRDPRLTSSEQYQTFVDIFTGSRLATNPPTRNGNAYMKSLEDFADRWQRGRVHDLEAELGELDTQIDRAKALGR